MRIITNRSLLIGPFEDWSRVRSPGRARRRRARGHPQRIRIYYKADPTLLTCADGTVVGHPETVAELRRQIAAKGEK
jgi:hypothetical protein